MNEHKFVSEYGYSIMLPDNWSEYDLEGEKNTNGFFDTTEWTGNLRISPLNLQNDAPYNYFKNEYPFGKLTEYSWGKLMVFYSSETTEDLYFYFWYIIENINVYFCSFTIDFNHKDTEKNQNELKKIESVLKTITTLLN